MSLTFIALSIHDYYYYKAIFSNLKVFTEAESIDSYPYISFRDVRSGKLSRFLRKQETNNNSFSFNQNVKPFSKFTPLSNSRYDLIGKNYPLPKTEGEYTSDKYHGLPYKTVAFFAQV